MAKNKIPFGTITITDLSKKLVNEALDAKRISSGKLVREFEKQFASLHGVNEAVAVSSGTDALACALAVLYDYGAKRGDEVIVPALSFVATGNAILHAGFTPVFVDIDRYTLDIRPELIESRITPKTRAILPVHLMGKPADMDPILEIAQRHGLMVIEDAAEAHGAEYKGRKIGSLADMACYSLYVAHIITTGEGGIVMTADPDKAAILRSLRSHGRACKCETCVSNLNSGFCARRFNNPANTDIRFVFERHGFSSKMNELEAALGLGSLVHFDEIVATRRRNLFAMTKVLDRYPDLFFTIREEAHEKLGPHALPIMLRESAPFSRDQMVHYLEVNGIDSRNMFQSMPTHCTGFKFLGHTLGEYPEAEYVADHGLHIGVHQDIAPEQIDYFAEVLATFVKEHV